MSVLAAAASGGGGGAETLLTSCLLSRLEEGGSKWDLPGFEAVLAQVEMLLAEEAAAVGVASVAAAEDEGRRRRTTRRAEFWDDAFGRLICRAVEIGDVTMLGDLLRLARGSAGGGGGSRRGGGGGGGGGGGSALGPPRLMLSPFSGRPGSNREELLLACAKDDYPSVRLLVSSGYRLRVSFMSREGMAQRETTWRDLVEMASTRCGRQERPKDDQMHLLRIIQMMAQPSYILACYSVAAEERASRGEDGGGCECWIGKGAGGGRKSAQGGLNDLMRLEMEEDVFHHCPASPRFRPNPDCARHLECNDPIYRCFDLAIMTSQVWTGPVFPQTSLKKWELDIRSFLGHTLVKKKKRMPLIKTEYYPDANFFIRILVKKPNNSKPVFLY